MSLSIAAKISSPCIKLCTLDAEGERCLGCGRTVGEIAGWARMNEVERRAIMARLGEGPA